MRMSEIGGPHVVLAALCLGLLAACTQTLKMGVVKDAIKDGLAKQLGVTVTTVTCPESRQAKAGDVFECTAATPGGGKFTVSVKQSDDSGNVNWEVTKSEGLLDLKKLEAQIQSGIKEQTGLDAAITCGDRYRDAEPGKTFECKAKTGDDTGTVVITVKDREGNVSWKLGGGEQAQ